MLQTVTTVSSERYWTKENTRIPKGLESFGNSLTEEGLITNGSYGGQVSLTVGSTPIPVGDTGGYVAIPAQDFPIVMQGITTYGKRFDQQTGNAAVIILSGDYGSGNERLNDWSSLSSSQASQRRQELERQERVWLSPIPLRHVVEEAAKPRHPLDVPARLDKFRELKDGWADGMQYAGNWGNGYGKAPSPSGLDWLSVAFTRHYPEDAPLPFTYPTPEGGVQMEWSVGSQEISLEVNLETGWAWWHRLDMSTDNDEEQDLDLNSDGWIWLGAEIMRWSR